MNKVRWGLISTGNISRAFAAGVVASKTGELSAVASRSEDQAKKFKEKFSACKPFSSYQSMLEDDEVDAVYIATPHPSHAEWAVKAARAGKHVLCEKPVAMNHAEAMGTYAAAEKADVFAMEAFMYRCHPLTEKLVELVKEGIIGDVRTIEARFGFAAPFDPDHRLFSNALGGGGILDIGCYPVSAARLIAGAAQGNAYAEPVRVHAAAHIGTTGVDEHTFGILEFEDDILAHVSAATRVPLGVGLTVTGTKGRLHVPSPWHASGMKGGSTHIDVVKLPDGGLDGTPDRIEVVDPRPLYTIEADHVGEAILAGKRQASAMNWEDSLGNMRALDLWRQAVGLTYEAERSAIPTLTGDPLTVDGRNNMKYGKIDGLEKRLSRLVMGCDNQTTLPHATVMFDDFFENGGTLFDTAHIYERGLMERLLGQWIQNRDIRDDVAIIGKGAHTPWCTPDHASRQLRESLDRLQTDYVDIYMLHRDNPDIPVSEFIDVLNDHVALGQIRIFGASNWTMDRLVQAMDYASQTGKQSFQVVSNNFSLARMVEPIWPGCESASEPAFKNWISQEKLSLMAWSSQARGFFTDRGDPSNPNLNEDLQGWVADDNFERRRRAIELANNLNVEPVQIALAYVLDQPFAPYALIGPRTLNEAHSSFGALSITLSPNQIAWLNLESDQP